MSAPAQETIHVGKTVIKIPNPDKFLETFTPVPPSRTRELGQIVRGDVLGANIESISTRVKAAISSLISDIDEPSAIVVHPDFGRIIVYDRIARIIKKARLVIEEFRKQTQAKIQESQNRENLEHHLSEFLINTRIMCLALREAINRLLIMYYANLPADMRPPTVNVILGYDSYTAK